MFDQDAEAGTARRLLRRTVERQGRDTRQSDAPAERESMESVTLRIKAKLEVSRLISQLVGIFAEIPVGGAKAEAEFPADSPFVLPRVHREDHGVERLQRDDVAWPAERSRRRVDLCGGCPERYQHRGGESQELGFHWVIQQVKQIAEPRGMANARFLVSLATSATPPW